MSLRKSTRINKYISESGLCSRREADRFVEQGNVWINGRRATTGDQVVAGDLVKVNGQEIEPQEEEDLVLIALNKPVGIVCTTEASEKDNIVEFVKHGARIFPIGRLDKDSQGLIFLTNNGDLVNKILRANNQHEKEYQVTVNKPVNEEFIQGMQGGVPILGQVTKKCQVEKTGTFSFSITLVQGLNRQIRRMCEYFGFEVTQLVRTRIMNVALGNLALGDWRDLTPKEIATLEKLTAHSDATPTPPKGGAKPKGKARSARGGKAAKPCARGAAKPGSTRSPKAGKARAGAKAGKPNPKSGPKASGKPDAKAPGKPGAKSARSGNKSATTKPNARPAKRGPSGSSGKPSRQGKPKR